MNVLLISTTGGSGPGGVLGAYRLYHGLKENGISAKLLAGTVTESNPDFSGIVHNTFIEKAISRVTMPLGLYYIQYLSRGKVASHPFFKNADIINYHSIHSGYFNYLALPKLTKNKPGVYTIHDMWAFTGHCITSYECNRWKTGCGKCPHLETYPPVKTDNTRLEWNLKNWAYNNSDLHIVAPSSWMTNQIKQSMLKSLPIHHIPNGININTFFPRNKEECRNALGIKKDKKVLIFSTYDLAKTMKGSDIVIEAINKLPKTIREHSVLLLMGTNANAITDKLNIETIDLGFVAGDVIKSIVFSSADIFIYPTRADNLPYIVLESMACGTPVVSINVGGISDLVRPNITGYLSAEGDIEDFVSGIIKLFENDSLRDELSLNCRRVITDEYSIKKQVENYMNLYKSIL